MPVWGKLQAIHGRANTTLRPHTTKLLNSLVVFCLLLGLAGPIASPAQGGTVPPAHVASRSEDVSARLDSTDRPEPRQVDPQERLALARTQGGQIMFVENVGQFEKGISFEGLLPQGGIALMDNALWLVQPKAISSTGGLSNSSEDGELSLVPTPGPDSSTIDAGEAIEYVPLRLNFARANSAPTIEGFTPIDVDLAYVLGSDPGGWHTNVPVWGGVRYVDLYPGVDLEVESENGQLNWRLIIKESREQRRFGRRTEGQAAAPDVVRLQLDSAESVRLVGNSVRADVRGETMTIPLPEVIDLSQGTSPVQVTPQVSGSEIEIPLRESGPSASVVPTGASSLLQRISFRPSSREPQLAIAAIPAASPAVVSPLYSFLLGNGESERAYDIELDTATGEIYATGRLESFPIPPATDGDNDAYVLKLASDGSLSSLTFFGGSDQDHGFDLARGATGDIFITGRTLSGDFPFSSTGYQTSIGGSFDGFLVRMDPTATFVIYGTFLGGSSFDYSYSLDLDPADNDIVYVTGMSASSDFPLKLAFDTTFEGTQEAFLGKFNTAASGDLSLVFSTYLGGTQPDQGHDLVVEPSGNSVFMVGQTLSPDLLDLFPGIPAFDNTHNGGWDAFVVQMNSSGSAGLYATYIGGLQDDCELPGDFRECLVVNGPDGHLYIAGSTRSTDFPVTSPSYQSQNNGGADVFAMRLIPGLPGPPGLFFSTYFGGSADDLGFGLAIGPNDEPYLVGRTTSSDLEVTDATAIRTVHVGGHEAFLAKLSASFDSLFYSTFIGGDNVDGAVGLAVDAQGNAHVGGFTRSSDFPVTHGNPSLDGVSDAFIVGIDTEPPPVPPEATLSSDVQADCGVQSYEQCQEESGNPINTFTGGFSETIEDLSIPTAAGPLAFTRSYSSLATGIHDGVLGFGWTHNHDVRLVFPDDPGGEAGFILFKAHTANLYRFVENEDGSYSPFPGVLADLTRMDGPPVTYEVRDSRQETYTFDQDGVLLERADAQGRAFTYTYDAQGRLIEVSDPSGQRSLSFEYDAQGRVQDVSDFAGRQVIFSYDAAGDLTNATDVLGQNWTYIYDADHHLTEIIDPRLASQVRVEYDAQGRAVREFDGEGDLVVELTYNPDGSTTVSDGRGHSEVHTYDGRGTIIRRTDPLGDPSGNTYDLNFRPTTVTNQAGATTSMRWSRDGAVMTLVIDAVGARTDLAYDVSNNLVQDIDPLGFVTSNTYSGTLMTSTTDALGNVTSYTYTPEGFLESVTDPLGRTTSYAYDPFGQRTSVTDPLGNVTLYRYDNLSRLIETEDPLGRVTRNDYDAAGRLMRVTRNFDPTRSQNDHGQFNIVTEYEYDPVGNQVAVTDTLGRTTSYEYDLANRLVRTTDPLGNVATNTYDAAGNLVATTDPLGRITTFVYDEKNRLVETIDPLGNSTRTIFDASNNTSSTIDALGRTTTFIYDEMNRLVETVDPAGNSTISTYDPAGNLVARTDELGRQTHFEYDALGRLIREIDPLGGITEHFYDAVGNRIQTTDARGSATSFEYDQLGRLERVVDALGNATVHQYDAVGNRTSITDANGNTTTFEYDQLDRLVRSVDPLGADSTTSYDALGNVLAQTDANGHSTAFTYDALNRMVSETDALGGVTAFEYDAVGNQTAVTDANGHRTTTTYDVLNRPIVVTDPNGNTTTSAYDAVGNLASSADGLGNSTSFQYDALNRRVRSIDPLGNATEFTYDAVGNQTARIDPNGVVRRFEYDASNRVVAVVDNYRPAFAPDEETNLRTEYGYDAVGNRLTITDALGKVTSMQYDALNRLIEQTNPVGDSTEHAFDGVGNRTSLTDGNGAITQFVYDAANRLTTIDYPLAEHDVLFAYDAAGNRVSMQDGLGATHWTYDALNRVVQSDDALGQVVQYGYDAVGNRAQLVYPDGKTVSYDYDSAGRLIRVTDWEGNQIAYDYDAANRLTGVQRPNSIETIYGYDFAGRVTSIRHQGLETVSDYAYTYDAGGRRVQSVEQLGVPETPFPTDTPVVASSTPTVTASSTLTPTHTSTPTRTPTPTQTPVPVCTDGATATPTPEDPEAEPTPLGLLAALKAAVDLYLSREEIAAELSESLCRKLDNAEASAVRGGENAAANQLGGFIHEVEAQRDKKISAAAADDLIARAQVIIALLSPGDGGPGNGKKATETVTATASPTASDTPPPTATSTATDTPEPTASSTPTATPEPVFLERTIDYVYDELNRLIEASYSTGDLFQYQYDEVGSTLEYLRTVGGVSTTTTYTYNPAYQLATAQEGTGPIWSYTHDGNGQLVEVAPAGDPEGARRYSYSIAGFLERVEVHDGAEYQLRAEMAYDGAGNRLSLTAHEAGFSLTTEYVPDELNRGAPLSATANGEATFYLFGRGLVGERTSEWSYYLQDLEGTPRQAADPLGAVTLTRSFNPWGDPLDGFGDQVVDVSYLGGLLDAATGLIYLTGGEYYDPETGRFLAPSRFPFDPRRPGSLNPYVPWGRANPLGLLLGPLAPLMLFGRRRKLGPKGQVLLALVALILVGLACIPPTAEPADPPGGGTAPPATPPEADPTPSPADDVPVEERTQPPPSSTTTPTDPPTDTPSPAPSDCPKEIMPTDVPARVAQETVDAFIAIRDLLDLKWIESDGRLKDEVLAALIMEEFSTVYARGTSLYGESLEAVSYQYRYTGYLYGCHGSCDTMSEQLNWMQDIEIFRRRTAEELVSVWEMNLSDARVAVTTAYQFGSKLESWTWGNYASESSLDRYLRGLAQADWWSGTGPPYVDFDPVNRFVIFTLAQNYQCNNREGGPCKGWSAPLGPTPEA